MKIRRSIFSEIEEANENDGSFSLIADFDGNEETIFEEPIDEILPILPLRNMVLFPGVVLPVSIGRTSSLKLVKQAFKNQKKIGAFTQRLPETEVPSLSDLYNIGTAAKVIRILEMPDGTTTIILQGMSRINLVELTSYNPYHRGRVEVLREEFPERTSREYEAVVDNCKDLAIDFLKNSDYPVQTVFAIKNISNKMFLTNFISTNLVSSINDKINLLCEASLLKRAYELLSILNREVQLAKLKANIQMRTREDIDQQQKEYFLQQQIKNIQDELGGTREDKDMHDLRKRADKKTWSKEVRAIFDKEMGKLERINPQSPDFNVQLNYLETMLNLPWGESTTDNLNLVNAEKTLNRDHYGLEKVKERILEYLAVLKMRGDLKSPILCLYGPPGVGKTSLGKSIAAALKRKYVRVSLGGLHDESEIRGHRRTYIGAMPGRIIKSISKAGSSNPVFILDEIDKIAQMTHQGDPASALLEVLDPEQNKAFHDNFLEVDYDLSKVMFIATANSLNTIPGPLLDRMELIEVSGYITEEKIEIARRHLIPKEMENVGLKKTDIKLNKAAIEFIIENYTRESGVRELSKKISKLMRRVAKDYATQGYSIYSDIKPADVRELLGVPEFSRDIYQGNEYAGVVTGLAWTAVGGEILFVETSLSKGKGGRLTLTGNLGDVMKESAMLALEYLKAHTHLLDIDNAIFENWNIHIHVPEGAIPKDGPSAGITMATSLASALTQRKVKANLAMTGEITLRGKVLPVGGIKEKILAAKRAGIKEIILSQENRKNIEEIPAIYLKGLTFHYVNNVKEVLDIALLDEQVENPINFTVEEKEEKK
ncbi:MAG: endopeptidase La [Bacteroidaceae bacterium]|nr:endopeptidase La [Bacteroidaceae bacterium]